MSVGTPSRFSRAPSPMPPSSTADDQHEGLTVIAQLAGIGVAAISPGHAVLDSAMLGPDLA